LPLDFLTLIGLNALASCPVSWSLYQTVLSDFFRVAWSHGSHGAHDSYRIRYTSSSLLSPATNWFDCDTVATWM